MTGTGSAQYITITESDGTTVVGHGPQPFTFTAPSAGDLRVYRHEDIGCGTVDTGCRTIEMTCNDCVGGGGLDGEDCSNAQDLAGLVSPFSGTTTGYNDDVDVSCLNSSVDRIFYIDVAAGETLTIGQSTNSYDSRHRVGYGGACPGDNELDCIDDPDITTTTWTNNTGSTQRVYWVQEAFSPSGSGAFTLEWTVMPPPVTPPNDELANAAPIDCGQTISGTTVNATNDDGEAGTTCGTTITAPGVWYTFVSGGGSTTISTCNQANYDTKLSLFVDDCITGFTCVGGNDDGGGCAGFTSEFTAVLEAGRTYYILVHGFLSGTGDFDLTLTGACGTPGICGDICDDALPIACGDTVSGSTTGATFDGVGTCGTSNTAPGVWYELVGNGDVVTASTCNQASYDTKISVFEGSCSSLVCVNGNDDGADCSGFTSELTFCTAPGVTYYILVHGFGSATGDFELSVACEPVGMIANDLCTGAIPVTCGDTVAGSTDGASSCDAPGFCGTSLDATGGVWYSFMGTDELVEVSTDNPGTNYDTKLGVFSGSCGNLICEDGDDDDGAGLTSTVFFAAMNQTYYIYVTGFSTTGDFELSVTCFQNNDDICDAVALTEGVPEDVFNQFATVQAGEPSPGAGSEPVNTCNSTDGWCSFETDVDNSVWYTFTPDVTSCYDIFTDQADLQIAVWTGDCTDLAGLEEVGANDDSADNLASGNGAGSGIFAPGINLKLTAGVTYWIQVDGYAGIIADGDQIIVLNTDADAPQLNCAGLNRTFDNDPGLCGKFVNFADEGMIPTATDDCAIAVLEFRFRPVDDNNNVLGPWSGWIQLDPENPQYDAFFEVGRYRIRWRAKDCLGQKDACTRFLKINDVEPPEITCNDNTEVFNGEEVIWLDPADYVTVDFENCAIESIELDPPYVTCEQLELNAPIPLNITVTDVNGLVSICDVNVNLDGLPCGWFVEDGYVDCEGEEDYEGSGSAANSGGGTFFLSSENCHNPSTDNSDEYAFIQTVLCGNSEIVAQVTSLTGNANGWAGVVMRESNDPGSKSVAMMTSLSSTQRAEVRYQTNGITQFSGFPSFNRHWLKINRFGNQFRMYHSFNGITWFLKQAVSVNMEGCLQVGLVLNSFVGSGDHSATFNNVSVSGGSPAPAFQANLDEVETTIPTDRSFSAYPNPTTGLTTVNLGDYLDTRATLEVVNTFGQVVFQRPLGPIENTQEDLDLSNLPAGVYIIRLHPEEGDMEMIQVVKQ